MYNEERKNRYIKLKESEIIMSKGFLIREFNRLESAEKELNKDVCDFTVYEIIDYYKMLNTSSYSKISNLNSVLSLYTQWCLQQNLVKDNQNHFLEIRPNNFSMCLSRAVLNKKVVSKSTLYSWIDAMMNPRDKFVILALFEGIRGKECCEIAKLKSSDIHGNIASLCTGRKCKVSDRLIKIIHECESEYKYYSRTDSRTETNRLYELIDTGYIIKVTRNTKVNDRNMSIIIYNSIRKSIEEFDTNGNITRTDIFYSGVINMIKERSEELNISNMEYFNNYLYELEEQYGISISKTIFLKRFGSCLE